VEAVLKGTAVEAVLELMVGIPESLRAVAAREEHARFLRSFADELQNFLIISS
jgi:hypothetical protein